LGKCYCLLLQFHKFPRKSIHAFKKNMPFIWEKYPTFKIHSPLPLNRPLPPIFEENSIVFFYSNNITLHIS
jgi:hypothetical protein